MTRPLKLMPTAALMFRGGMFSAALQELIRLVQEKL